MNDILLLRNDGKIDYIDSIKCIKHSKIRKYMGALVPIEELNCYFPVDIKTLIDLDTIKIEFEYQIGIIWTNEDCGDEDCQEAYKNTYEGLEGFIKLYTFISSMVIAFNTKINNGDDGIIFMDFIYTRLSVNGNHMIKVKRTGDGSFDDHINQMGYPLLDIFYSKFTKYFNVIPFRYNKKINNGPIIIFGSRWKHIYDYNHNDLNQEGLIAIPLDSIAMYHCIDMQYIKYIKYVKKSQICSTITIFENQDNIDLTKMNQYDFNEFIEVMESEYEIYDFMNYYIQKINDLLEFIIFFNINLFILKNTVDRWSGEESSIGHSVIADMHIRNNKSEYTLYGSIHNQIKLTDIFQCLSYTER